MSTRDRVRPAWRRMPAIKFSSEFGKGSHYKASRSNRITTS
jgi:hypothetical protein